MAAKDCAGSGANKISCEDLERLIQESQPTTGDGWKNVRKDEYVQVWQKTDPNRPVHLIRSCISYRDIPPSTVVEIIQDLDSRTIWDKIFSSVEVLESNEDHKIVYWYCKMPVGIKDRDIIQKMCTHYDQATDTTYIMFYHTTHPSKPLLKRVIRMETIWSGVIIKPHEDIPNSTQMSLVSQTDLKGLVPHFIVNSMNTKIPGTWHESLMAYYQKEYVNSK